MKWLKFNYWNDYYNIFLAHKHGLIILISHLWFMIIRCFKSWVHLSFLLILEVLKVRVTQFLSEIRGDDGIQIQIEYQLSTDSHLCIIILIINIPNKEGIILFNLYVENRFWHWFLLYFRYTRSRSRFKFWVWLEVNSLVLFISLQYVNLY